MAFSPNTFCHAFGLTGLKPDFAMSNQVQHDVRRNNLQTRTGITSGSGLFYGILQMENLGIVTF